MQGSFSGTLLSDKQDGTRTHYRRNRYYDPSSGRFTQEDPIGFAGGLNLYGFAGSDPANFSDPFGLCPPQDNNAHDCPGKMGAFVMLGQMAPAINRSVAGFAAASLGGGAVGAAAGIGSSAAMTTLGLRVAPMVAAASRVNINIEDDVAEISGRGITVMANIARSGGTVTLDKAHMDGGGPGSAGLIGMRDFFVQFGRQMGAHRVIVNAAARTTGRNVGRVPRPQVIDIPK